MMPQISIRLPTQEEEERTRKFQVHNFYLAALAEYLESGYGKFRLPLIDNLLESQRTLGSFTRIQRRRVSDADRMGEYLTLAWASELQFRLAALSDSALLRYSNAWAPVHLYYAVYMSAQAWLLSMAKTEPPGNHTATLNSISNQIKQRSLFPRPWSVTSGGCPQLQENVFYELPAEANPDEPIEVLSRPEPSAFWPRCCKLLSTTRRRRLNRHFARWKKQRGRRRMFQQEKRMVADRVPPTTLFDFFWRLRVRSNYRDVKTFLMSDAGEDWQSEFFRSMEVVMEASCCLLQQLVTAYAGADIYQRILREFLDAQSGELESISRPFEMRANLMGNAR